MNKNETILTEENYSKIYAIYFPKLVRFSQTYILSKEDAENIVQDIFVYLWEHPMLIESASNINALLFTIVKNRCIDYLRKRTIKQTQKSSLTDLQKKELQFNLYSLQAFDENNLSNEEIGTIINKAIDSLPKRCREIFILSRLQGLHHKEISYRLNISTNTIEGQIAIALKKLRKELKQFVPLFIFII